MSIPRRRPKKQATSSSSPDSGTTEPLSPSRPVPLSITLMLTDLTPDQLARLLPANDLALPATSPRWPSGTGIGTGTIGTPRPPQQGVISTLLPVRTDRALLTTPPEVHP
jgi:hypothetical protein